MNTAHRKPLPATKLDYFDARAAVDALRPGAWDRLPYTSRVLAENLVRRCDPATLDAVVSRTGLSLPEVSLALHHLVDAGLAVDSHGWWSRPERGRS